jgi:hypothetical protein
VELLLVQPGAEPGRLVARSRIDISKAPGLVHLRRGLRVAYLVSQIPPDIVHQSHGLGYRSAGGRCGPHGACARGRPAAPRQAVELLAAAAKGAKLVDGGGGDDVLAHGGSSLFLERHARRGAGGLTRQASTVSAVLQKAGARSVSRAAAGADAGAGGGGAGGGAGEALPYPRLRMQARYRRRRCAVALDRDQRRDVENRLLAVGVGNKDRLVAADRPAVAPPDR